MAQYTTENGTIRIGDNEVVENVFLKGPNAQIIAKGDGWTIRNVAVDGTDDTAIKVQTGSNGTGLIDTVYTTRTTGSGVFVHPRHAGHIDIKNVNMGRNRSTEHGLYGSRPGNPSGASGILGEGGTVTVDNSYVEDAGGAGWRLGSQDSIVKNSVVNGAQVGLWSEFNETTYENCDVAGVGIGVRAGVHYEDGIKEPATIHLNNCRGNYDEEKVTIEHDNGQSTINGSFDPNPVIEIPAGVPASAEEAASGESSNTARPAPTVPGGENPGGSGRQTFGPFEEKSGFTPGEGTSTESTYDTQHRRVLSRVPVATGFGGEVRGIEPNTLVKVRFLEGDRPVITQAMYDDELRAPLTYQGDWRTVIGDAVIEIAANGDSQPIINVGKQQNGDRQGVQGGFSFDVGSGEASLLDGAGYGLKSDGQGNWDWRWNSISTPGASETGSGGSDTQSGSAPPGQKPTTLDNVEGTIGGGEGYANTVSQSDADLTVSTLSDLLSADSSLTPGDTLFIDPSGDYDLGNGQTVTFKTDDITIASDRGQNGSSGAKLYENTHSNRGHNEALLELHGDGIRVTGLRVIGPQDSYRDGDVKPSSGILLKPGYQDLEVDNVEIAQFNVGGITPFESGPAHIHNCHIHHCQQRDRGYGIRQQRSKGMNVYERNLFDANRHSVKAKTGSYTVRNNVFGPTMFNHAVDCHGQNGKAGRTLLVYNNRFEAPASENQECVRFRGVPRNRGEIHHNWIHMENKALALRQSNEPKTSDGQVFANGAEGGWKNVTVNDNHYGESDPPNGVGVVDTGTVAPTSDPEESPVSGSNFAA